MTLEPPGPLVGVTVGVGVGVGVTVGVTVGVAVGVGVGVEPAEQDAPLTVQFWNVPDPLALKPKLADPPAEIVPFQDALVKVWCVPLVARTESQDELIVDEGRSNSTRHPLIAELVWLLIVHLPSKPVPQSEDLTHAAVTAADADDVVTTSSPDSSNKSAPPIKALRRNRILRMTLP